MIKYFTDIWTSITTILGGMGITFIHLIRARQDNVTLQYPEERWPRPERNIGFDHDNYNVIRTRLHVDMDDCIGCLKCERACPVDCIKIVTEKAPEITKNYANIKLMTTRYCLKYELGLCETKQLHKSITENKHLFIENKFGKYKLEFDCTKCQMFVKQ